MSRRPDQKPKAIHDDAERLELVFKRLLLDEKLWPPKEKQRLLKLLNPVIAAYREKCVDMGVTNGGAAALRRSA